jgi:hypothetical protein
VYAPKISRWPRLELYPMQAYVTVGDAGAGGELASALAALMPLTKQNSAVISATMTRVGFLIGIFTVRS